VQKQPKKPRKIKRALEVAVIDCETDPFKHGRKIGAFACEFLSADLKHVTWGPSCVKEMATYLRGLDRAFLIYAHNGGKFDFMFFADEIENPVKVISSRIVSCQLGQHEMRDSFAIIPVPQAVFEKQKIDYGMFEYEVREKYKEPILEYLHSDCAGLLKLVNAFHTRFGDHLTVGGMAINQLKQFYKVGKGTKDHDIRTRPFYYGGRVECFESGELYGDWHVYDVNSMYPYVMAEFDHPDGRAYFTVENTYVKNNGNLANSGAALYFAHIECESFGAFPRREKDGISFPHCAGEFWVCSHEVRAAIECGTAKNIRVISALVPRFTTRFDKFVRKFNADKVSSKLAGDKVGEMFAKFVLNSCYGKFGQNPENYRDYLLVRSKEERPPEPWRLVEYAAGFELWSKPVDGGGYYDVAVAASITSAARATLMRGLTSHHRPAYCDTDSIICDGPIKGLLIDKATLGAWKLEARGDRLFIAGKKTYALYSKGEAVKWASKGVRLQAGAIVAIARGKTLTWHSEAPSMRLGKATKYVARRVKRTI